MRPAERAAAYLQLPVGELADRARELGANLEDCDLCPRRCRVDRTSGETGWCGIGRQAAVASLGPHYGEERPLVGSRGSGTVFFSGCNLGCAFCQNDDISQNVRGRRVGPETLAAVFLEVQEMGCHNLNLVTPTHVAPQILEALVVAARLGLGLPIVWNCGGYESMETLAALDGVVDIYMPDFKLWDPEVAERLLSAPDYPEVAREAIAEMHRQVGDLEIDDRGVARRGVLLRHLVLPGGLAGTPDVAAFMASLSPETYFNLMDQYRPCHHAFETEGIQRPLSFDEWREALAQTRAAGLTRLD
jgi:putative pyruvate formate lyase activating enzyme